MSRTYKTRPYWVKLNDPKFPTKERHQHHVVKREKTGRMEEYTVHVWTGDIFNMQPVVRLRPQYREWTEYVPCSIDIPEKPWREERHDRLSDNREKLCDKRPLLNNSCSCCTRSYAKRLSAQAQRATINQQLHNAVRDYGWTTDPEEWYDVDIHHMSVNEDWKFWD